MLKFAVGACAGLGAGMYARRQSMGAQCAAASPLSPADFRPFKLTQVVDQSADSKVFRFALPSASDTIGMNLCSCIVFKFTGNDGKPVIRPYTPITGVGQQGYFDVLVKKYNDSKMGTHLFNMKVGESIDVKGPYQKIDYQSGKFKNIGMIAGGTGITPMFQLLREAAAEKNAPRISMIGAYRTEADILLRREVNALAASTKSFDVTYILSQPGFMWRGEKGHVTKDLIKSKMPPPSADKTVVLVCGPSGFMKAVSGDKDYSTTPPAQGNLSGILKELGYSQDQVFKF